jgi:hypothetical protein
MPEETPEERRERLCSIGVIRGQRKPREVIDREAKVVHKELIDDFDSSRTAAVLTEHMDDSGRLDANVFPQAAKAGAVPGFSTPEAQEGDDS